MRKNLFCVTIAVAIAATAMAGDTITIKDITSGKYAAENLRSLAPLAGGNHFAQINSDRDKILEYAFDTGEQTGVIFNINDAKGEKIVAIDDYTPSPDGSKLLICTDTKRIYRHSYTALFYVYDVKTRQLSPLSKNGRQQAPVWAPDSRKVAFVRDNNIFVTDIVTGEEQQVTTDGRRNEVINGIPDWVNEEEFGFSKAMAFTADSRHICWIRYDETRVKTYALQMFKGLRPENDEYADYPGQYAFKYPKAGQDNALVTAWSYDIASNQTKQIDLPIPHEGYIPRILPGIVEGDIVLCTMNRHQDTLAIYSADATRGDCRHLVTETVPKYIKEDVLANLVFTNNGMLLLSDRDGAMQAYLYGQDFRTVRKLTNATYGVTAIYGYDEKARKLYFQAAGVSPMEREVYVADNKGRATCLTKRKGWNKALFSADYNYYILTWSDMHTPFECDVFDIKGNKLRSVVDNAALKKRLGDIDTPTKEFFTLSTSEGVNLNGWMVKPPHFNSQKKYPVIMFQYSGPGSQQVVNSWSIGSMGQGAMFDQYFAQQGFIVVCTDGRGTGGRGADFEKCTYLQLGELEARDQVETAIWLARQPYIDADNIGIWGWSYGGFCTLMSMSEGREVFKAGVAVAPPTCWKYYDTIYTERFMRTPQENPDGYDTNPTVRAEKLHGALLICHGLADDNVHPQNTFEYTEALVQADKDFKEQIYTNRNHSIYGGNTRNHLLRQIATFFKEHLQ
ncbi:MAG: S9 family peptidase [Prevotella sp.]|nr:S9 family peptidase [Prevotella sp.]